MVKIKFKISPPVWRKNTSLALTKLFNKGYCEIRPDPSYPMHECELLCSNQMIIFDEAIYILNHSILSKNIVGAMSFIYWNYCSEFYMYIEATPEKEIKKLKRKTKRYINRWYEFIKRSDDTFYPQNEWIRKIYHFYNN